MLLPEDLMKIADREVFCPRHGGYRDECNCPKPERITRRQAWTGRMVTVYRPGLDPDDGTLVAWGPSMIRWRSAPSAPGVRGKFHETASVTVQVYTRS